MGRALFDIVGDYQLLYDMATDVTGDPEQEQTFADTLEALKGELEAKAEGYIHVIKQLEMEQERAEQLEYEWHLKAIKRKDSIQRMKSALVDAMKQTGHEQLEAGDYTLKIVKNGGQAPIIYDDESAIPQSLMRIKYEKDAKLIREYLAEHPETSWAHIGERGVHLGIK
jgi:hypothetical protein